VRCGESTQSLHSGEPPYLELQAIMFAANTLDSQGSSIHRFAHSEVIDGSIALLAALTKQRHWGPRTSHPGQLRPCHDITEANPVTG